MAALTKLETPDTRGEEWALVRRVAKADGSVGRIFEGHLNAQERLRLDGIDPEDHWLGVWGADPAPNEGEPAHIEDDELHGTKVFCSGRGRAHKSAGDRQGHARVRRPDQRRRRGRQVLVPRRTGCGRRNRTGCTSTARRIVATLTPLTTEPYLSGDAIRTAAAWAGIVDSAVESALAQLKDDDLRAHAAGRLVVAQRRSTAGSSTPRRPTT